MAFWVAGLGERRRLAGTTSRSSSTKYVHSVCTGRNPAPLDHRKHRNNAMRCVLVGEEGDGEGMRVRTRVYEWLCGVFVFGEIWRDVPQYKMMM